MVYREWLAFTNFVAIKLQAVIRVKLAKKLYRKMLSEKFANDLEKLMKKNCAKIIAKAWRKKLHIELVKRAIKAISKTVRGFLAKREAAKRRLVVNLERCV